MCECACECACVTLYMSITHLQFRHALYSTGYPIRSIGSFIYAPSHRQDSTYLGSCYIRALAESKYSSVGSPWGIDPTSWTLYQATSRSEENEHSLIKYTDKYIIITYSHNPSSFCWRQFCERKKKKKKTRKKCWYNNKLTVYISAKQMLTAMAYV